MAFRIAEMTQDQTTTSGTGTYDLIGAVTGFRSYNDELSSFSPIKTYYCVFDTEDPPNYEVGVGTWTAGSPDTLSRVVLRSTNGDLAVDWPDDSLKNVVCGVPGVVLEALFDPDADGLVHNLGGITTTSPISATGLELVSASSEADMRSFLSLVPGTNVQAYSTHLSTLVNSIKTASFFVGANGSTFDLRTLVVGDVPQGPGSTLDADTVDGIHLANLLNFDTSTPYFYESSELTLAGTYVFTGAHGFSAIPRQVAAFLRCKTPDGGYAVDDEIDMASAHVNYYSVGQTLWRSSSQVGWCRSNANPINLIVKGGASSFSVDDADWRVVLRAWK